MASTTIEQALSVYLLSQSSFTDLVGQRLYYVDVEENETMPYVAYRTVAPQNEAWAFGEINAREPLIQFDIVGYNKYVSLNIANTLLTILKHFSGDMDGITIEVPIEGRGPREYRDQNFDDRIIHVVEFIIQVVE